MKVHDLIRKLKKCPLNAHVVFVHPQISIATITHNPAFEGITTFGTNAQPISVEIVRRFGRDGMHFVLLSDDWEIKLA